MLLYFTTRRTHAYIHTQDERVRKRHHALDVEDAVEAALVAGAALALALRAGLLGGGHLAEVLDAAVCTCVCMYV